ncbi:hypothetical protein IP92_00020 [Pseudoduganella flava]|uniref:DUF4279 domain-containing protein n=1 Tax=Pseudoduganella flava TaxID=871742 RepID=A0A562Q312_9BURK|nr:hypothetical protein [Pseudoduganella flava]QGZ41114.1 hypothetical protein GO485_20015 [Pseudoduganella flava]TWI51038.1 hypothetical protein IP92_00020 [Pseudoduganella flava]
MNKASLKVYGDEAAVADVRDGLPSEPEGSWQKGDVRPDGRVRIDAGFYVDLGQDENPDALLRHLRAWLHECEARGITFDVPPLAAELRITVVGMAPQESLDFSIADLTLLVNMGITLSITA